MPFSLNDRVLSGLLAAEDAELRALHSAMERIEADPVGACHSGALDHRGRLVYAAAVGRFWLYYWIRRDGRVHFLELLAESNRRA
jgi:hypothetical protein